MICRLPKENALLLRYLLAVLHGIQGNAQENQMTSFNLSVCIAPSMLWPPGAPCSPEVEGEGTKKVRVPVPLCWDRNRSMSEFWKWAFQLTLLHWLSIHFFFFLQVCELVKFLIEHCQQVLREDPSSLFGGPPQRLNSEEMGTGTQTNETNVCSKLNSHRLESL